MASERATSRRYRVQAGEHAGVVTAATPLDAARTYARRRWLGEGWAVMVSGRPEPGREPAMQTFISVLKPGCVPDVRLP